MALVPLYRLQGHGDHFYTTSATERDNAIATYGYASEGIACYVQDSATASPSAADSQSFWSAVYSAACASMSSVDNNGNGMAADKIAARARSVADAALAQYAAFLGTQR